MVLFNFFYCFSFHYILFCLLISFILELPSIDGKEWKMLDFAPLVFKKIRNLFKVDPKKYMFTLGPKKIIGNFLLGSLCSLDEVISSGRSGSFFWRTNDQKYFIKTLPPTQESFLYTRLRDYHEYIENNPNTFLPRFYVNLIFYFLLFIFIFFHLIGPLSN